MMSVGALYDPETGIVFNVIEIEDFSLIPNCVDCQNYCGIGDIYDPVTNTFTRPTPQTPTIDPEVIA